MVSNTKILSLSIFLLVIDIVLSKKYEAHIVDSPSNYGLQQQYAISGSSSLTVKRPPAPFSGPQAFRLLSQKCFTLDKGQYEWKLCPFHNATQEETGTRWNPYRGVLGVWAGWKVDILTNAFEAMSMTDGDDCGDAGPRQVEVNLVCGSKDSLLAVEEPSTCHYAMTFESSAFCSEENLRVYPNIGADSQQKWDRAYTEWKTGLLTSKGYVRAVSDILAKLRVTSAKSGNTSASIPKNNAKNNANINDNNNNQHPAAVDANAQEKSMTKCSQDYKDLLERYERLGRQHAEAILELGQCRNNFRLHFGAKSAAASKSDLLKSIDD